MAARQYATPETLTKTAQRNRRRGHRQKPETNFKHSQISSVTVNRPWTIPDSYRTSISCAILSSPLVLISGFCTSDQMFAAGFLQIPYRGGHPCLWLEPSHYQGGLEHVRAGRTKIRTAEGNLTFRRSVYARHFAKIGFGEMENTIGSK